MNDKKRPDVVITDFDRTLTYLYRDTQLLSNLADMIIRFYKKYIVIPDDFDFGVYDGYLVWHKLHDLLVNTTNVSFAETINKEAESIVTDFEIKIIKKIGLFSDIPKATHTLHDMGIKLGVVSSNATSTVCIAFEQAGILSIFDYIQGRPYPFNPLFLKPNPFPITTALGSMNAANSISWYVGDDVIDMKAATAARVIAVGVCTGKHSEKELRTAGADMVFSSFVHMAEFAKCYG